MLTNYLSSAAKFSPPNGRVEVDVATRDDTVRISISRLLEASEGRPPFQRSRLRRSRALRERSRAVNVSGRMETGLYERRRSSRRRFLEGVAVAGLALGAGSATLRSGGIVRAEGRDLLERVFSGRPLRRGSGAVQLEVPRFVESGEGIPITVSMSDGRRARALYIVVEQAREPLVCKLTLKAAAPYLAITFRIPRTSKVWGVVELPDGALLEVDETVHYTSGPY